MSNKYKISVAVIAGIATLGLASLTAAKPAAAANPAHTLTAQARSNWDGGYDQNNWRDRNVQSASFRDRLRNAERERREREIREREWRRNHDRDDQRNWDRDHARDDRNQWDRGNHDGWDKDHNGHRDRDDRHDRDDHRNWDRDQDHNR
ncbi:hypothetical protein CCAX7_21750 [Capsulimonas corticalis]|uniref:Uncharacterized protein n=1 Tax=Capsulimonas corticalis TaxID=2219043 RepID=A0A402D1Z3_9BACT|nr:hypothetical protein [Capsulimonas corticalis]BDI30124.1 hypothetical protein CCAX7_21750 [Capsulimonas corticalis]